MSLKSTAKGGGNFTPVPAGSHPAWCFSIVDLGTQKTEYMGTPKLTPQVRIGFEVPSETIVIEGVEKPMTIHQEYTNSLSEKANLRHHLVGWRGVDFTDEQLKEFDLSKLIGKSCMISVVHKTSKSGNVYGQITSISKLPKGMAALPPMSNTVVLFDVGQGRNAVFEKLPDFLKEKIALCKEWTSPAAQEDEPPTQGEDMPPEDDGDSIPF